MSQAFALRGFKSAIALIGVCFPVAVQAADQVLSCVPAGASGPEVRVLISESLFSKGRIFWPAPTGTTVFDISEKSAVSYTAVRAVPESVAKASEARADVDTSGLYINRLNGELRYSAAMSAVTTQALARVCRGEIEPEQCAQQLQRTPSTSPSLCSAKIDCGRITEQALGRMEVNYSCKRSFKKF